MTELTLLKDHLISEKDEKEFQTKHFIDSVLPYKNFVNSKNVADIGSGAGFPAIPLAIILPKVNFTLVDSLQKRVNFLNKVIDTLGLENCRAVHSRAEDFAKEGREKYDAVTARAVAALNILLEYTAPLAKTGGTVIAYKGSGAIIKDREQSKKYQQRKTPQRYSAAALKTLSNFISPTEKKDLSPYTKR